MWEMSNKELISRLLTGWSSLFRFFLCEYLWYRTLLSKYSPSRTSKAEYLSSRARSSRT